VGALDCIPVAADYGLDDLYRKCVRWTAKFFVKVWPTKAFASLRKEFLDKCLQYHIVHMVSYCKSSIVLKNQITLLLLGLPVYL